MSRPGENRRSYPSRISKKASNAQLVQLLYGCTDERLAGFTAAGLAGSYNVPVATAESMLCDARRGRGL